MQETSRTRSRQTGKRTALGRREKCRLIQLGLCVGLFLVVLLGKGVAPEGLAQTGEKLLLLIRSDTDFKGAFSNLGEAVSKGDPVWETLGDLAVEVFGVSGEEVSEVSSDGLAAQGAEKTDVHPPVPQFVPVPPEVSALIKEADGSGKDGQESEPEPEQEAEPKATLEVPAYTGPDLPEGSTMEYVDLELEDTVTPVMGVLSSSYGYRTHPVSGEYLFHAGVDLAASTGTPILAFADGVVEYIGESDDDYGMYIQLVHENGVTSFYCHCSALYVQKGETVTKGQAIAAVGETGNATGPHLHLELKRDGVRVNPIYYIEYSTTEN